MKRAIITTMLALGMATPALAERDFPSVGLGVTGGTLGIGLTFTVPILDVLNARAFGAGLGFDIDVDGDDSDEPDFEGDLVLGGIGGLLDYHPFRNGFRASVGVLYAFNNFEGTGTCNQLACDIGNGVGVLAQGDEVRGEVDYAGVAPYLGIGWGNAVDKAGRWSFSFDLGALFTGSPDVSVRCTQVSSPVQLGACQAQAEAEEDDLEDEIGDFDVYPVVSLGAAYRF